jgi:hypothetical protein
MWAMGCARGLVVSSGHGGHVHVLLWQPIQRERGWREDPEVLIASSYYGCIACSRSAYRKGSELHIIIIVTQDIVAAAANLHCLRYNTSRRTAHQWAPDAA